ncbi:hypothetical protein BGV14_08485, partial [Clostridioides difficile]
MQFTSFSFFKTFIIINRYDVCIGYTSPSAREGSRARKTSYAGKKKGEGRGEEGGRGEKEGE